MTTTEINTDIRITPNKLKVFSLFLDLKHTDWLRASVICDHTRLASGTLSPMLAHLMGKGWIEMKNVKDLSRRNHKVYKLTSEGRKKARSELQKAAKEKDSKKKRARSK